MLFKFFEISRHCNGSSHGVFQLYTTSHQPGSSALRSGRGVGGEVGSLCHSAIRTDFIEPRGGFDHLHRALNTPEKAQQEEREQNTGPTYQS